MKNEIGRKITSLTIMAIMFAGGMAIGVPSFMPVASADTFAATDGELSVSSTFIQGGAVLEIVVNDPDVSSTEDDINNVPSVLVGGTSYDMNQAVNGKWYLYPTMMGGLDLPEAGAYRGALKGKHFGVYDSYDESHSYGGNYSYTYYSEPNALYWVSFAGDIAGGAMFAVGLPLWIVGGVTNSTATDKLQKFNENKLSLSAGITQNGLTIALRF